MRLEAILSPVTSFQRCDETQYFLCNTFLSAKISLEFLLEEGSH